MEKLAAAYKFTLVYQLQKEIAEVGPHSIRVRSVCVWKVNQVQEQPLVDVKVLKM